MHIRLLAVGARQPEWVDAAVARYVGRLPRAFRFGVTEIDAGKGAAASKERQGERVLAAVGPAESLVALDERGAALTSTAFADKLRSWQQAGTDLAFVIGGADGLSDAVRGAQPVRVVLVGNDTAARTGPGCFCRAALPRTYAAERPSLSPGLTMTDKPAALLASRSPRRTRILNDIGINHEVQPADIDESRRSGESPADYYAAWLSKRPAQSLPPHRGAPLPSSAPIPLSASMTRFSVNRLTRQPLCRC